MFQSIIQDVRTEFQKGNTVTRLIFINLFVFLFLTLLFVFIPDSSKAWYYDIRNAFALSNSWWHNLTHPWAWLTHMFVHDGFWHILWNMLFLYWFGRIVGDLIGDHHILPLYLYGGLLGGITFVMTAGLFGYIEGTTFAIGASGATMAIVLAAGFIAPNYLMRLILIGTVKLKYVVGVIVLLDIIRLSGDVNVGGHVAHLGGATMGWFYIYSLRAGVELGSPIMKLQRNLSLLFTNGTAKEHSYKKYHARPAGAGSYYQNEEDDFQDRLDEILDKIREKGYNALSQEEKDFLQDASKR
jgi:membrane associated rhomboid family serine protease